MWLEHPAYKSEKQNRAIRACNGLRVHLNLSVVVFTDLLIYLHAVE